MTLTTIKKWCIHMWRAYGTLNNIVIGVALVIAASWAWGSVAMMQTNFDAQKAVDDQKRQLELTKLRVETLKYKNNYYQSEEYKDLAARTNLGLAAPGEKLLILPPNSSAVKQQDAAEQRKATTLHVSVTGTNFDQWIKFLTGQSAGALQK